MGEKGGQPNSAKADLTLRLSHLINDLESKSVSSKAIPDLGVNLGISHLIINLKSMTVLLDLGMTILE